MVGVSAEELAYAIVMARPDYQAGVIHNAGVIRCADLKGDVWDDQVFLTILALSFESTVRGAYPAEQAVPVLQALQVAMHEHLGLEIELVTEDDNLL